MAAISSQLDRIAEGREAEIFAWEGGRVLRLFRDRRTQESIEREIAAMRAARSVLDAVPEVYDIVEVDSRLGVVMERIDGPDYFSLLATKPWRVWSVGALMGTLHAQLHATEAPSDLESLKSRIARAGERAEGEAPARLSALLATLPDGNVLCHGDFHPGNVLATEAGPVIIDWPNATAGDPAADFARTDLMFKMGDPPPGTPALIRYLQGFGRKFFRAAYRRAYLRERPTDAALVDRWQLARVADRLYLDRIPAERDALRALLRKGGILD